MIKAIIYESEICTKTHLRLSSGFFSPGVACLRTPLAIVRIFQTGPATRLLTVDKNRLKRDRTVGLYGASSCHIPDNIELDNYKDWVSIDSTYNIL